MSTVRELHHTAMELADQAWVAGHNGEQEQAAALTREAFQREAEAAKQAASRNAPEPSRSVLHRSAAALAYKCGEYREAERLISVALTGDPPPEIAQELRALRAQVDFQLYRQDGSATIDSAGMDLVIEGPNIGYDAVLSEMISERLHAIQKLIGRTMDRLDGKPFTEDNSINNSALQHLSSVRPGGVAITLRINHHKPVGVEKFSEDKSVFNEVLTCVELLAENRDAELQAHIADDVYYRNFIGLAQQLAPDGDRVRVVELAVVQDDKGRRVTLTRVRNKIGQGLISQRQGAKQLEATRITGRLLFGDTLHGDKNDIRVVDENNVPHLIYVPAGMMTDIVRPLWGMQVVATVAKGNRRRQLTRIEPA